MSTLRRPIERRDHVRGNPNAPVTLLEYGDFECPFCGQAYPIVKLVKEDTQGIAKFVFRHFPLSQAHPHALHAAYAAEAAGMQGKFWEMHDMLFEHQDMLEDEHLVGYARALRLDINQFIRDMGSQEVQHKVREDFMSGIRSGVNGTPTIFINERRFDGVHGYNELFAAIEEAARESQR